MRTLTTLLTGALLLSSTATQARILRVNSVAAYATTCTDCFQTLLSAYSAALDDDTIHIEPADANYGDLTIQKRLTILGAGYKLGSAPNNSGLQANSQTSRVNLLSLSGINSSGTVIMGLHFVNAGGGLNISNTSNIQVRRCFFDGQEINFLAGNSTVANILIAENFITGSIDEDAGAQTVTGLTLRNNIITSRLTIQNTDGVMENILIMSNTLTYNGAHQMKNAEVAYNVFYGAQSNISGTNNTVHDNVSAVALTDGDASNNVVNMANVYNRTIGTDDSKYDILASSPYNEGGAQARGAFSGASPYRLSGIPPIPAIYQLQSTVETTPGGGPIQVTLSTRSNP